MSSWADVVKQSAAKAEQRKKQSEEEIAKVAKLQDALDESKAKWDEKAFGPIFEEEKFSRCKPSDRFLMLADIAGGCMESVRILSRGRYLRTVNLVSEESKQIVLRTHKRIIDVKKTELTLGMARHGWDMVVCRGGQWYNIVHIGPGQLGFNVDNTKYVDSVLLRVDIDFQYVSRCKPIESVFNVDRHLAGHLHWVTTTDGKLQRALVLDPRFAPAYYIASVSLDQVGPAGEHVRISQGQENYFLKSK